MSRELRLADAFSDRCLVRVERTMGRTFEIHPPGLTAVDDDVKSGSHQRLTLVFMILPPRARGDRVGRVTLILRRMRGRSDLGETRRCRQPYPEGSRRVAWQQALRGLLAVDQGSELR